MSKIIVPVIDFAHGSNVKGKRSPDGKHLEWIWSRTVGKDIAAILKAYGYTIYYTNPLDTEGGLSNRVRVADSIEIKDGQIKLLISLHNNAAGDGTKWMSARGFEVWTKKGVDLADDFSDMIFDSMKEWFPGLKLRVVVDKDLQRDKEGELAVLKTKTCFSVLIEYLFQDNKEDVALLTDEAQNKRFADCIVDAVVKLEESLKTKKV